MDKLDNSDNKYGKFKNFLEKHATIILLISLTVIVSLITYYRVLIQIEMGPVSDSFDFLSNALVFVDKGIGYSDLRRPPFFAFIISLFFRLGYISQITIFVLDGVLFVFGVIGMFLFLKLRFNDLESFLGGLLYATFPVVLLILGFGFSDLVTISFTIWSLYFMVLAVKKNSKYFYLAFSFAMLAFLTRYNSGLLIFPIFIYILINKDKINFKDMYGGIIASLLIIVPVLIFFYEKFGSILYPFINFGSSSTGISSSNPNIFYYIQILPDSVGIQGLVILLIIVLGILIFLFSFMKDIQIKNNISELISKNRQIKIKLIIFVLVLTLFLVSFAKTFYIVNELLFFILAFLFYDFTKNLNIKFMDLNILVFAWLMTFFIFQSIYTIKINRYFLPMAPPIAYFMILGLSEISKKIKLKIRNRNVTFPTLVIILTSIILLSTASTLPMIEQTNNELKILNNEIQLSSQWFANHDPNYKNENIYSDLWPNFSWYLKTKVQMVPIFESNQSPDRINHIVSNAFNEYLVNNNADYFLTDVPGLNLTSYTPIKNFGNIIIYKKKS